jgi:hypothetical protein
MSPGAPAPSPRGRARRLLSWAGRGLVPLLLVVWLARKADLGALVAAIARVPVPALLAAFALGVTNVLLGGARWWALLGAFGGRELPSLTRALRVYFVGLFFNTFLPGSVGGDVVRGAITRRCFDRPAAGFVVVLVERVVGFASLGVVLLAGAALRPATFGLPAPRAGAIAASLALAGAVVVVVLRRRLPALWAHVPRCTRPAALPAIVAISVVGHALSVATVGLLASGMGLRLSASELLVVVPLALIAAFVPLSLAGMGPREATLIGLLCRLGVTTEDAAALSLAYAAIFLALAATGGALQLLPDPRPET